MFQDINLSPMIPTNGISSYGAWVATNKGKDPVNPGLECLLVVAEQGSATPRVNKLWKL